MSILVDLYASASLTEAVNIMKTPQPFVTKNVFSTLVPHEVDHIMFEQYVGSEEIAKFANTDEPNPTSTSKTAKSAKSLYLPRTFESKIFSAQELIKLNAIGQIFSKSADRKQEQMKYISTELEALKNRVLRLREKMACEALSNGTITVSQDNISIDYDFGFTSDNKFTLGAAALWTASTGDPVKNLRAWKRDIAKRSGINAKWLLLGTTAADTFLANEKVLKYLDNNNYKLGSVNINEVDPTGSASYIATIAGIDIYEYSQQYKNDSGTAVDMIPVDRAIMIGQSKNFRLHYGPAYRIENNVAVPKVAEYYLEVDKKSDDKGIQWNLEQKSLPTIHDPGAVISAKVV